MADNHPTVDPHALTQVEFGVVRRGYDPDQVRNVLHQAANALSDSMRLAAELEQALVEAQQQPPTTIDDLDDNDLMVRLGEKTVRVLDTARQAAAEVEGKGRERAAGELDRAKEEGLRLRSRAEKALRTAQQNAANLEKDAERKSRELLRVADVDADRLRNEAQELLRGARGEADHVENEAREHADRLRSEIDTSAARAKAKADAVVAAATTKAAEHRDHADQEVARLRQATEEMVEREHVQATEGAERLVAEAEAKAARIEAEAGVRYEERVGAGRQRGRELVAEAEDKRAEILRALASTRKRGQLNIEQLRVARDRLLESFTVAREAIDQAGVDVTSGLPEAKEAAERLLARVGDDDARSLDELEAEFGLDRLTELRVLSDDDDPDATLSDGPAGAAVADAAADDDGFAETATDETESTVVEEEAEEEAEEEEEEEDAPDPGVVDLTANGSGDQSDVVRT